MKKSVLIICFLFLSIFALAQEYIVEATIKGIENQECYLGYYFGDKQFVRDTVIASSSGYVKFKSDEPLNHGIYLLVMEDMTWIEIIVASPYVSFHANKQDLLSSIVFQNSNQNTQFYEYQKFMKKMTDAATPLREKINNPSVSKKEKDKIQNNLDEMGKLVQTNNQKFIDNNQNTLLSKILLASQEVPVPQSNGNQNNMFRTRFLQKHYLDNIDFNDGRMLRTPIFHKKIDFYLNNLTYQVPDSVINSIEFIMSKTNDYEVFKYLVNHLTHRFETSKIMGMDEVFVHMVYKYINSDKVDWIDETQLFKIKDRADKLAPILLGRVASDFQMKDNKGVYKTLHSVESDFTILCFYDPDCSHCKKEVPLLKDLKERVIETGLQLQIVAVNVELEPEKWHNFIKEHQLNDWVHLENFNLKSDFRKYYDIYKTPELFLLDKNKKILAKRLGVEQLEDFIQNKIIENN